MSTHDHTKPEAKSGVAIICFLLVILGQGYLLRNVLFAGSFFSLPAAYYIEMVFSVILLAGIVICWIFPTGWSTNAGCAAALVLFAVYALTSILSYDTFKAGYLSGFNAQFESAGGALVGLKLVLVLVGVTAGIPVAPRIDDREYARRLREKVQKQDAEWARASVKGAQKDLENTLNKLKETLSEEEMAALLKQLQDTAVQSSKAEDPTDPASREAAREKEQSVAEEWRGWGAGM